MTFFSFRTCTFFLQNRKDHLLFWHLYSWSDEYFFKMIHLIQISDDRHIVASSSGVLTDTDAVRLGSLTFDRKCYKIKKKEIKRKKKRHCRKNKKKLQTCCMIIEPKWRICSLLTHRVIQSKIVYFCFIFALFFRLVG